jgi:predicted ATP-grasp superfamily ATP-dependent carboligase
VDLVLILRVQEATTQETRLVSTGKYKELQRLNIKRAIRFMLDNYSLRDRFVAASAYAPAKSQQQVLSAAQRAVESLTQILEYFPNDLVANDLSPEQKTFVLAALESTSTSIDGFLEQMPAEVVSAARRQIAEENQLNEQEVRAAALEETQPVWPRPLLLLHLVRHVTPCAPIRQRRPS